MRKAYRRENLIQKLYAYFFQTRDVVLGVCLPASCNRSDVLQLLHMSTLPTVSVLGVRTIPDPDFAIWREPVLYILT